MSRPELRIGDREREAAVSALGEHYVAGRLTKEEFDERTAVAWRARTSSQLAPLFVDLPPLHDPRRRPPVPVPLAGQVPAPRAPERRRDRLPLMPVLLVMLGLVVLTGEFWAVMLVFGVLWWSGALRWLARVSSGGPARGSRSRRP